MRVTSMLLEATVAKPVISVIEASEPRSLT